MGKECVTLSRESHTHKGNYSSQSKNSTNYNYCDFDKLGGYVEVLLVLLISQYLPSS